MLSRPHHAHCTSDSASTEGEETLPIAFFLSSVLAQGIDSSSTAQDLLDMRFAMIRFPPQRETGSLSTKKI